MRYASIDECEFVNGEGVGISLFVQGCHFHCKGCFNEQTWDFSGGQEFTEETKGKILELLKKGYVNRFSILGGEPLADENVETISELLQDVITESPKTRIWIYTGYKYEDILSGDISKNTELFRMQCLVLSNVLVDGRFIESEQDYRLKFRGSKNQRVIDVKQSWLTGEIVEKY